MFLVYHLERSYRSNERPDFELFLNFKSVGLNFLETSFVFMRIYAKHRVILSTHLANIFNIKYILCINPFDEPIHCIQNQFVKFDSFNIH